MDAGTPSIDFTGPVPRPRPLDVAWIHGSPSAKHNTDPDIQIHEYDERTVILRQNVAVDYEAPFLFLLFGDARAVLIDTGATASAEFFPLRRRRTIVAALPGRLTAARSSRIRAGGTGRRSGREPSTPGASCRPGPEV